MSALFASDAAGTRARFSELKRYMEREVLSASGEFVCTSCQACRSSVPPTLDYFEGQMSHVGPHYDLSVDGQPFRVMILGQEYGHGPSHCGFDDRRDVVENVSGLDRRYYAEEGHHARNPHMRGTTSALRVLFGLGLGTSWDEEFLDLAGERAHIFEAFALINLLLCSAVEPGKEQLAVPESGGVGRSSTTMRRNCLRHFCATVRALEPTVLVVEGKGGGHAIAPIIEDEQPVLPDGLVSRIRIAGVPIIICRLTHPSAPSGRFAWGDKLTRPYLLQTAQPALAEARRQALT